MGKFAKAKALFATLPADHPLKRPPPEGYGGELSRNNWRDMGRNYDVIANAAMESEFKEQLGEIEGREQLWEEARAKTQELFKNHPEYKTPEAYEDLINNMPKFAQNIKDAYIGTGEKLEALIAPGGKLDEIWGNVTEGIQAQLGTAEEMVKDAEESGIRLKDIFEGGAKGIEGYLEEGIPKMYQTAEAGLEEAKKGYADLEKGIGKYETIYGELSTRATLPGEEIRRMEEEGRMQGLIGQAKELAPGQQGALTAAMTGAAAIGEEGARDAAIRRAEYLVGAKQNYAEALLTGGQEREAGRGRLAGQYTTLADIYGKGTEMGIKGTEAATGLRGYGEESATDRLLGAKSNLMGAQRYGAELGYEAGMGILGTELDITKQAGLLKAMGYTEEADMMINQGMMAGQEGKYKYEMNELMPWQAELGYYMGGEQQYDPFAAKMEIMGDEAGWTHAQIMGEYERQAANKTMWGQILSGVLGGGGSVLSSLIGNKGGGNSASKFTGGAPNQLPKQYYQSPYAG